MDDMHKTRLKIGISGFSLVEVLIALAILSIVIALGMPSYSAWIQNATLRNAAESILNGLQTARIEATKRNTPVQFIMDTGTSWTVACPLSADCPVAVPTIDQRAAGAGTAAGIVVTPNAALPDPVVVTFDSLGGRANPPVGSGVARIDLTNDPAKLSAADSKPLSIIIETGGSVRMCNPLITVIDDPRKC
jgi:type IV fimbrial biogenesis protein FimT